MRLQFLLLISIFNLSVFCSADEPNQNLENKWHRNYENYAKEVPDDQWKSLSQEKEEYAIESGDNLWNISQTIFGSPYYWSKIWALNDSITNPHNIMPGSKLSFRLGNSETPPSVESKTVATADKPTDKEESERIVEDHVKQSVPKSTHRAKVLAEIPPSLGEWRMGANVGYDSLGFYPEQKAAITNPQSVKAVEFVTQAPNSVGSILETETGSNTASSFQYVFIELKAGGVGDHFVAYQEMPEIEWDGKTVGLPIQFLGELKVVETVNPQKNIFKAIVSSTVHPVIVGAKLRKGDLARFEFSKDGNVSNVSARIVGGEYDSHRRRMGIGSFVYLDRGLKDQITEGTVMTVLRNQLIRNPDSLVQNQSQSIATIKVVSVSDQVATAFVIENKDYIIPGDYTGADVALSVDTIDDGEPSIQPALPAEPVVEPSAAEPTTDSVDEL